MLSLTCAALLLASASVAFGEEDAEPSPPSFSIPGSPAFSFLGTTPGKITQASSLKDVGVQLVNVVDADGKVKQGFAFDQPIYLLTKNGVSLKDYQSGLLNYALANLQVSAATVQTSGDMASTDMALGVRTTLTDHGDPYSNSKYVQMVADAMKKCLPTQPGTKTSTATLKKCVKDDPYVKNYAKNHWNAFRLSVGAAVGARAPGSELKETEFLGASTWAVTALPLGAWGQVLAQVQYDFRDANSAHSLVYAGRLNIGTAKLNTFVEAAGTSELSAETDGDSFVGQWSAGVEVRVGKKTWISTGVGSSFSTDGADKVVLLAGLRWAVADEARLNPKK